ncbi:hypothetical protein J1605_006856 [Eschrichtius robustus]|uniref:Uncharacterized protein n=1 Tax=Eschrichtius robustus TaxID=9764 RepID=A0AB34H2M4_ESCRO|nr:hypothetical protein J1605_006856 [Eschrichtius robustus]
MLRLERHKLYSMAKEWRSRNLVPNQRLTPIWAEYIFGDFSPDEFNQFFVTPRSSVEEFQCTEECRD